LKSQANLFDSANLDALEFNRGSDSQTFHVTLEEKHENVRVPEHLTRTKHQHRDHKHTNGAQDKGSYQSRIDFTHG
jgi:hypothetical protein